MLVGIIDYDCGNLKSVKGALDRIGVASTYITIPKHFEACSHIILPGVGAFRHGMKMLDYFGFTKEIIKCEKPFLGICLGMQLLAKEGLEGGLTNGLGVIPGIILHIPVFPRPHLGWNDVGDKCYYFVHSYYFATTEYYVVGTTEYKGWTIPACVKKDNFTGVQFHPEKSGKDGLDFLKEWLCLSKKE